MHVPSYLYRSRHSVFYFRWPLPSVLHPQGLSRTIKLSLGTREPKAALEYARVLCYAATVVLDQADAQHMDYVEMRAALVAEFSALLAKRKAMIDRTGRLSREDVVALRNTAELSGLAVTDNEFPSPTVSQSDVERLIERRGLPLTVTSPQFHTFAIEYTRALASYGNSVLQYDASLQTVDLEPSVPTVAHEAAVAVAPSITLPKLVEFYLAERALDPVAPRSSKEWGEHFAFLQEVLGTPDMVVSSIGPQQAQAVKAALLKLPKNRKKLPATRNLSLAEAMQVEGIVKIAVPTINKYLQTYISLFGWALRNQYVATNPFDGTFIPKRRGSRRALRDAFSPEQVSDIVHEAVHGTRGFVRHDWQKWSLLIAVYTGARLNEIAQLLVNDIREVEGVLCFDITDLMEGGNQLDDRKQLKTVAAKRVVPVHPVLIELGLLEYKRSLESRGIDRLFPEFTKGVNGWGTKLSRWANGTFFPNMGMKTSRLVFHSFRHTVVTRLTQLAVPEPMVKALVGHEQQGITHTSYFGEGYRVEQLAEAVRKLQPNPIA